MLEQTVANTLYIIILPFSRIILITFTITTELKSIIRSSASKTKTHFFFNLGDGSIHLTLIIFHILQIYAGIMYASKQTRYNIYGMLVYNSTGTDNPNSKLRTITYLRHWRYHVKPLLSQPIILCCILTVLEQMLQCSPKNYTMQTYFETVSTSIWQNQNKQKCYHRTTAITDDWYAVSCSCLGM
jgi:hypothetical protein